LELFAYIAIEVYFVTQIPDIVIIDNLKTG